MGRGVRIAKAAVAIGATSAAFGALVAPRRRDEELLARWEKLCTYRYAHRGLHDNRTPAPENSLAAFTLAREWGYGSELDVHLSSDGELVVIHDSDLRRACDVCGTVEEMSRASLQELPLFGTHEHIPTLSQVLDVYEGGAGECPPLVVELKTHEANYPELTEKTLALLDAHNVPYCVESFDPRVLWWLRKNRPDVIRGQLSEHFVIDKDSKLSFVRGALHGALLFNVFARPDFVAYRFEHRHHPAVLLACGVLGAWRVYWTVGSEDDLNEADCKDAVSIFEGFMPLPMRSKGEC